MPSILNGTSGGSLVLPLFCVFSLALVTLVNGVAAARKGSRAWIQAFWISMGLFLATSALLTAMLSSWFFALVFLLPGVLLVLLFRKT